MLNNANYLGLDYRNKIRLVWMRERERERERERGYGDPTQLDPKPDIYKNSFEYTHKGIHHIYINTFDSHSTHK